MKLSISLGQMNIRLGKTERNLAKAESMVAKAAENGADVILLPELWSTGYDLENAAKHASGLDSGIFRETAQMAANFRINVVGSCLSQYSADNYGNTAVWFSSDGSILADYTKIHLFRLMQEEQYLEPGNRLSVANTPFGRVGLAICYDLRFPELFRSYALSHEAVMIFLPAEWPNPRFNHWRTLLKARAIENQYYIIACNRVGESKGISFFGHSMIADPWGDIVLEGKEEEALLSAVIDLERVKEVRRKIPVFRDRREDLY